MADELVLYRYDNGRRGMTSAAVAVEGRSTMPAVKNPAENRGGNWR